MSEGTSSAEVAEAAGLSPQILPRNMSVERALKEGAITAGVVGLANALETRRRDGALQLGCFVGPAGSLAYAVNPSDKALLSALDDYIANVRRTAPGAGSS